MEGSDRWNNILFQSHLKFPHECQKKCLVPKVVRISVDTLRPALVTGCLFAAGLKGCPQASSHEGSLVHDEKSARENNIRCLSDDMLKRHLVESSD